MARIERRYNMEEFARRGEELFARVIAEKLAAEDPRKFVLIDIDSGDFEVDADEMAASNRLRLRRPQAQIWMRRVGSPYARRMGGAARSEGA